MHSLQYAMPPRAVLKRQQMRAGRRRAHHDTRSYFRFQARRRFVKNQRDLPAAIHTGPRIMRRLDFLRTTNIPRTAGSWKSTCFVMPFYSFRPLPRGAYSLAYHEPELDFENLSGLTAGFCSNHVRSRYRERGSERAAAFNILTRT